MFRGSLQAPNNPAIQISNFDGSWVCFNVIYDLGLQLNGNRVEKRFACVQAVE
jgi:hypothetical protein